jgi:hypothetical protein
MFDGHAIGTVIFATANGMADSDARCQQEYQEIADNLPASRGEKLSRFGACTDNT